MGAGNGAGAGEPLLSARGLVVRFLLRGQAFTALRGVDLDLYKGESLAIVGESGSGKSVLVKTFMGLLDSNGWVAGGSVRYAGMDLAAFRTEREWLRVRGGRIAMVFQDPMTSLNPLMTIGKQIREAYLLHHRGAGRAEARRRVLEVLGDVGIGDAARRERQYPHEFSGGMRQRAVIAAALACEPEILICDEPTTALDVTIQAQILALLRKLQDKYRLTVVYITHDLGVVANVAGRVAVMYAGDVVETGTVDEVFYEPSHPYTWALLSSLPQLGERGEDLYAIAGAPPNMRVTIRGDAFAPRNPQALLVDFQERPPYFDVSPTHRARTWLLDPRAPRVEAPPQLARIRALHETHGMRAALEGGKPRGAQVMRAALEGGKPRGAQVVRAALEGAVPATPAAPAPDDKAAPASIAAPAAPAESAAAAPAAPEPAPLLSVRGLRVTFGEGRHAFEAVRGVSFDVMEGETFGLVGESGSGKTTIGRAIVRLCPVTAGEVLFRGERVSGAIPKERDLRLTREIQMIFQDPMASLNERAKIDYIVSEGLQNAERHVREPERKARVAGALESVGLLPEFASRFPHEFSGGQRQRVGIARSLIMSPAFIVADEPISALDVSIRAQVLNLMSRLKKERGLTYLFISHDLSVLRFIADRIAVIYKGALVELAGVGELFARPLHPYTRALLSAVPLPDPEGERGRAPLAYDPACHADYGEDPPRWQEIAPRHFVLANAREAEAYRRLL